MRFASKRPQRPNDQLLLLLILLSVSVTAWVVPPVQVVVPTGTCMNPFHKSPRQLSSLSTLTSLCMAKKRMAKKVQKVDRSRPDAFYDAMDAETKADGGDDDNDKDGKRPKKTKKKQRKGPGKTTIVGLDDDNNNNNNNDPKEAERQARMAEAIRRMEERPDVSTMSIDPETGIEVVRQGKSVMDVVTRRAVQLSSLGPDYRLAQFFPGVPPEVRAKHRFPANDWTVPDMVDALRTACSIPGSDSEIPPHPSITNEAIDFVVANRDYLGFRMKRTLGRLQLKSMSQFNKDEARAYQRLWKNFWTLENHISAPFRQMMMDAEGRLGPNFGNLDISSYCNGELYERCANYLVLKGQVATWEKKLIDADYYEKTPQTKDNYVRVMARGDPKRYLPDPPILFTLKECTQVCALSQQMTKAFCETPELFDDLPPELRFIEAALQIRGGTALRQFMIDEFCPAEGITPQGLREGMRRLICQLENMQIDPYGDLVNVLEGLSKAMAVGSEDDAALAPYEAYLGMPDDPINGPGAFQTYTFDHDQLSLVRFLDSQYERSGAKDEPRGGSGGGVLGGLFNFGGANSQSPTPAAPRSTGTVKKTYQVPKVRAAGRPHELGWLDLLKDDDDDATKPKTRLGEVAPGKIIMEE